VIGEGRENYLPERGRRLSIPAEETEKKELFPKGKERGDHLTT